MNERAESDDRAAVRSRRLVAGLLAMVAVVVYARSLGSGLVYDAATQIGEDDFIHTPRNLVDVLTLRVMAHDVLDFNRPLHLLSLMIDALIWGRRPFGFHLTSVLLHAACVVLLFDWLARVLRRAGQPSLAPPALGAALFAVHPLCVEAVAEPSYREELLVCLFLLLALRLADRWRARAGWPVALGIVACAFCAVAAKETGVVVLPAVALALGEGARGPERRRGLVVVASSSLAVGAFVFARFALAPVDSAVFRTEAGYLGGSFAQAMSIQPRIWTFYLAHLVWPRGLSADYDEKAIAAAIALAPALLLVLAFVVGQLVAARRSALMRMSLVLFWGALLPASNLFPMFRPAADRYLYVPMLGVACAVAALFARVQVRPARWLAVALFAVLAVVTVQRQAVWSSELALWTDTLAKNPRSLTALDNLGWAKLEAGHLDEAAPLFAQAAHGLGGDPLAGLALTLEARGQPAAADRALRAAIARESIYGDPVALRRSLRLTRAQIARLVPLISRVRP